MKCSGCKQNFSPKKPFHKYCGSCVKDLRQCGKCGKAVFPKNNKYSCCGVTEAQQTEFSEVSLKIRSILGNDIAPVGILDYEIHGPNGEYYYSGEEDEI